jgi:hypothetical protein
MVGSSRSREGNDDVDVVRSDRVRGGFSFWSVLTGVVVAFGAFFVLFSIISGILAALGVQSSGISAEDAVNAGIAAGIGVVVAQFLSYLWGGYTAGRMARGAGLLNGIVVPILAIVIVAILGAIVAGLATSANVETPDAQRLPLPLGSLADIGTAVGIGLLVAMLVGGALGGMLGERWHTKLERRREADAPRQRVTREAPPPPRTTTRETTGDDGDDRDTGSRSSRRT